MVPIATFITIAHTKTEASLCLNSIKDSAESLILTSNYKLPVMI